MRELVLSILSSVFPIIGVAVMLFLEPELTEAIGSGIIFGSFVGSIFGVVSLTRNKRKSKLVTFLSIIPMIPLSLYLLLLIITLILFLL